MVSSHSMFLCQSCKIKFLSSQLDLDDSRDRFPHKNASLSSVSQCLAVNFHFSYPNSRSWHEPAWYPNPQWLLLLINLVEITVTHSDDRIEALFYEVRFQDSEQGKWKNEKKLLVIGTTYLVCKLMHDFDRIIDWPSKRRVIKYKSRPVPRAANSTINTIFSQVHSFYIIRVFMV